MRGECNMCLYRIVYSYESIHEGERAKIYYVRTNNEKEAVEKFKKEYPDSRIESVREAVQNEKN